MIQGTVWNNFFLLLLLIIPMLYLPRFLQREIQAIFLLITRQSDLSTALFSLLFFPGVLLHESSHFIMAQILGVRTGKFSIIPRRVDSNQIRLGYVETASTDFFRDALIGLAPLITGGVFVALAGIYRLGLESVWLSIVQGQVAAITHAFESVIIKPDFWLWFYLVFTVSSTMMPSEADRRAWLPLVLAAVGLLVVIVLIGVGPWLMSHFELAVISALNAINLVFGITIIIHVLIYPPTWLLRKIISRITRLQVA